MNRNELADLIVDRIKQVEQDIKTTYNDSKCGIGYFIIDNLFPSRIASDIYDAFPRPELMKKRRSLREFKFVAAQMNKYNPVLEEAVYAFQDAKVVGAIRQVCNIQSLCPDEHLYAGGISLMGKGQFLNPHLDNSHDKDRNRWRVMNLLYYVAPGWLPEYGGNLEIWPNGVKEKPITIHSLFNRLAVMATHGSSWHSVSPISHAGHRACVSNYYFSDSPLKPDDTFHVTSFRGRPGQRARDLLLRADNALRQGIRTMFPNVFAKTDHLYEKPEKP